MPALVARARRALAGRRAPCRVGPSRGSLQGRAADHGRARVALVLLRLAVRDPGPLPAATGPGGGLHRRHPDRQHGRGRRAHPGALGDRQPSRAGSCHGGDRPSHRPGRPAPGPGGPSVAAHRGRGPGHPEPQRAGRRSLRAHGAVPASGHRALGTGGTGLRLVQRLRLPARGSGSGHGRRRPRLDAPPRNGRAAGLSRHAPGLCDRGRPAHGPLCGPRHDACTVARPGRPSRLSVGSAFIAPEGRSSTSQACRRSTPWPAVSSSRACSPTGFICVSARDPRRSAPSSSAPTCSPLFRSWSRPGWRRGWAS